MPFDGTLSDPGVRVIRRARELIEENGWCQGSGRGPLGEYCILTALYQASANEFLHVDASRRIMAALGIQHTRIPCTKLHVWNDHPDRTCTEVFGLLDRAILGDIS